MKKDGQNQAKVLEGPVPSWKVFGRSGGGTSSKGKHNGLSRFDESSFDARFPFGAVEIHDPKIPVDVTISGWSPFIPLDADNSPVAGIEYSFVNSTEELVELVYSFHAAHFMATGTERNVDTEAFIKLYMDRLC